jgi:hypothetical protein
MTVDEWTKDSLIQDFGAQHLTVSVSAVVDSEPREDTMRVRLCNQQNSNPQGPCLAGSTKGHGQSVHGFQILFSVLRFPSDFWQERMQGPT